MSSSAHYARIRLEVESALARKVPSALSPRSWTTRERLLSGVEALDVLLEGGLPVGAITEFVGGMGSGRTTAAMAFGAATAREARVAAWVDVSDALDPASAAMNGVELARMLWVRCAQADETPQDSVVIPRVEQAHVVSGRQRPPAPVRGGGSPHPRSEGLGMPQAISAMLQAHGGLHDESTRRERKKIGTPGMPNRPLQPVQSYRSADREEQVPTDRRPSRRALAAGARRVDVQAMEAAQGGPRCAEPEAHRRKNPQMQEAKAAARQKATASMLTLPAQQAKLRRSEARRPWTALDHALRATDLLLQSGGFGLIVLDLGGTPAEMAWRIPLATWFRYRAACERSRTSLLLLTQHPCARSSAELVVRMEPGGMKAEGNVFTGLNYRAEIERRRFQPAASARAVQNKVVEIRKPPQGVGLNETRHAGQWTGRAAWAV